MTIILSFFLSVYIARVFSKKTQHDRHRVIQSCPSEVGRAGRRGEWKGSPSFGVYRFLRSRFHNYSRIVSTRHLVICKQASFSLKSTVLRQRHRAIHMHGVEVEAKKVEVLGRHSWHARSSARMSSGKPLANQDQAQCNPLGWYFGSPRAVVSERTSHLTKSQSILRDPVQWQRVNYPHPWHWNLHTYMVLKWAPLEELLRPWSWDTIGLARSTVLRCTSFRWRDK